MANKLTTTELPDIGKRIRDLHIEAWAGYDRALERARDAGLLLIEAKPLVGHGKWESWVSSNCRFESPQATKYMRIASQWDEIQQKRTSGSPLSINAAARLIAKPKLAVSEQMPDPELQPRSEGTCNQLPDGTDDDTPSKEDASTSRPPCPECGSEDFFPDGTCRACIPSDDQNIIDMRADDEAPEEPDEPESAGSMLESVLRLTIDHWLEQYPEAPECLVLSILESLTADWRRA